MTMHPDALLPARRAIRVMHRNAPCDDCPLTLSFSRNFFALLRKEGRTWDGWFALRKVIDSTSRILIEKSYIFFSYAISFREYFRFKLDTPKIYARENRYYDLSDKQIA